MATDPALGAPVPVAAPPTPTDTSSSYVDWPAIFAGALVAAAISVALLTFGSAIGLSMTNPFGREGVSLFWIAIAMAIWVIWVQVSSFMAGGYLAGRMRRRNLDSTEHESDVRDGFHGLVVWAVAVVITAVLAFSGVGNVVQGTGAALGAAGGAVAEQVIPEDPFDTSIDLLFRGAEPQAADTTASRAEISRILVAGTMGDGVSEADRAYLIERVSAQTGLSPAEAEARVDEVIAQAQAVQDDIAEAAATAGQIGVLAAFLTAAALAVGAAGAWFAATLGGSHRDKQTIVPFFNRTGRPVT